MSEGSHGEKLLNYVILLIISQVCDVISNCIKEALVRSQPMNQEQFNFQVSIFQIIIGLIVLIFIKIGYNSQEADGLPFSTPEY